MVWLYFILSFVISWGGILTIIGLNGFLGVKEISDDVMPFVYLATLLGPSTAGLLLTGLLDGKNGFREMLARLIRWRVDYRWYVGAILTVPLLITAILCFLSRLSPVYLPAIATSDNKSGLLLSGLVMGLMVGLFEELGWTGFAVPRLMQRYGVIATGLIVGTLWGVWHFPLFLGAARSSGSFPPAIYLLVLLFSFLPAYRVLMVWIYTRTDSLLVVILAHAPLTASQLILIPSVIAGTQVVLFDLIFAAILWAAVAVVITITGRRFVRQPALK